MIMVHAVMDTLLKIGLNSTQHRNRESFTGNPTMNPQVKPLLKLAVAVVLAALAVWFAFDRLNALRKVGPRCLCAVK